MPDDPRTTNDESNDQPLGHFGTLTMAVSSLENGHPYTLDVELLGKTVERVYFPKGGWVDFYDCELDSDLTGTCEDEKGRSWLFEGESSLPASEWLDENEGDKEEVGEGDGESADDDGYQQPSTSLAN
jgi:hypothetical protein